MSYIRYAVVIALQRSTVLDHTKRAHTARAYDYTRACVYLLMAERVPLLRLGLKS